MCGVAGATGRVARRGSRSPARPPREDAVASPATAPWALEGRPRRGARRREGARRRAPWRPSDPSINLVSPGGWRLGSRDICKGDVMAVLDRAVSSPRRQLRIFIFFMMAPCPCMASPHRRPADELQALSYRAAPLCLHENSISPSSPSSNPAPCAMRYAILLLI